MAQPALPASDTAAFDAPQDHSRFATVINDATALGNNSVSLHQTRTSTSHVSLAVTSKTITTHVHQRHQHLCNYMGRVARMDYALTALQ